MSDFAAADGYSEQRPAFTDEGGYSIALTLAGANSLTGATFAAEVLTPAGLDAGAAAAALVDADARTVAVGLPGQTTAGDYVWLVRRTDDSSGDVVARGVIEVTDPGAG